MQKEGDTIGGIPSVKQPAKPQPHMLLFREPCCRFYSLPRTVSGKTTTDMLMILRSVEETGAAGARLSGCLETMAVGLWPVVYTRDFHRQEMNSDVVGV